MLGWLQSKQDVNQLIAKGQYSKAIKVLEKHLRADPKSVHLRKLLAGVLERDGQRRRSVEVLEGLVQEFTSEGFVTKAIAVLKKIQRIDPNQSDAEEMLSTLVKIRSQNQKGPLTDLRKSDVMLRPKPPTQATIEEPEEPDEGMVTSVIMPSEFWFEEAVEGRDDFNWSPLFNDFSKSELAAMIGGLRLLIKKPGSIIYTQGEPGNSLFVLSGGSIRIYRQDSAGHNEQVAIMNEGGVFGTPSILFGKPRNRTITAVTECELLELDQPTFQNITASYPRVGELVRQLHDNRQ